MDFGPCLERHRYLAKEFPSGRRHLDAAWTVARQAEHLEAQALI
jgi:hypothetical protein